VIRGLDLHVELEPATVSAVRQALLDYKVVFFPEQHLSPPSTSASPPPSAS